MISNESRVFGWGKKPVRRALIPQTSVMIRPYGGINAPLCEVMGFDDEGRLDYIEHLDMTYSEFAASFCSEGYGWDVEAISWLWDALNRPYSDIAAERGFDDEDGEPQEPN